MGTGSGSLSQGVNNRLVYLRYSQTCVEFLPFFCFFFCLIFPLLSYQNQDQVTVTGSNPSPQPTTQSEQSTSHRIKLERSLSVPCKTRPRKLADFRLKRARNDNRVIIQRKETISATDRHREYS